MFNPRMVEVKNNKQRVLTLLGGNQRSLSRIAIIVAYFHLYSHPPTGLIQIYKKTDLMIGL